MSLENAQSAAAPGQSSAATSSTSAPAPSAPAALSTPTPVSASASGFGSAGGERVLSASNGAPVANGVQTVSSTLNGTATGGANGLPNNATQDPFDFLAAIKESGLDPAGFGSDPRRAVAELAKAYNRNAQINDSTLRLGQMIQGRERDVMDFLARGGQPQPQQQPQATQPTRPQRNDEWSRYVQDDKGQWVDPMTGFPVPPQTLNDMMAYQQSRQEFAHDFYRDPNAFAQRELAPTFLAFKEHMVNLFQSMIADQQFNQAIDVIAMKNKDKLYQQEVQVDPWGNPQPRQLTPFGDRVLKMIDHLQQNGYQGGPDQLYAIAENLVEAQFSRQAQSAANANQAAQQMFLQSAATRAPNASAAAAIGGSSTGTQGAGRKLSVSEKLRANLVASGVRD